MRQSMLALAVLLAFAGTTSVSAQDKKMQDKKASKCCAHMCPVANATTKAGFEVVAKAQAFRVKASELLS